MKTPNCNGRGESVSDRQRFRRNPAFLAVANLTSTSASRVVGEYPLLKGPTAFSHSLDSERTLANSTLCLSNASPTQRLNEPLLVLFPLKRIVPTYLANIHIWIDPLIRLQAVPGVGNTPEHRVSGNGHP